MNPAASESLKARTAVAALASSNGGPRSARPRLDSVDLLRGVVMVVMALDHVRDFFSNATFSPLDLSQTNAAYFLTRWITHYCAATFVFLAGTGAFLGSMKGKSRAELSRFLLTRGLWMVFLELTVVRMGWRFSFDFHQFSVQVFWAIGWSMVALSLFVWFNWRVVAAVGIAMIVSHNAFDRVGLPDAGAGRWAWSFLHAPAFNDIHPKFKLFILYPVIPWIGVMAAGFAFGKVFALELRDRQKWLFRLGTGLTLGFILLRWTNWYGDPHPWVSQKSGLLTFFSFLNCEKYPPSLLYLMMTLGPAILCLWAVDGAAPAGLKWLVTIGRVPMFYYLLHIPLIHALAILANRVFHGQLSPSAIPNAPPSSYGFDLWAVYLAWIVVVAILYPACRWWAALKQRRTDIWLSYL
jgi:uncharacterized membrane protein